jgi:hypothetical protein
MTLLGAAVNSDIPVIEYWDPENSVDPTYTGGILKVRDINRQVFGIRDKKGWAVEPKARYYDDNILETFFNAVVSTLNTLPDRRWLEEEGVWAYFFSNKKTQVALMKELGVKRDDKLSRIHGAHVCPLEEAPPLQALFILDSWPSLVSEKIDEQEEASNAMALDAREFSKHLKRVVGKLRRKSAAIFGVNQIRERPGVMYGPTEYEPGGNALKYFSIARNQIRGRAIPPGWGKGSVLEEPSITGKGVDKYQFKHIKNTKNKTSTPYFEAWSRIWISDSKGKAHGFDPVFDVFEYLKITNQVKGNKKSFMILLPGLEKVKWDWISFKKLVLAEHFQSKEMINEISKKKKLKTRIKIRKICFGQIAKGEHLELMRSKSESFEDADPDDDLEDDE